MPIKFINDTINLPDAVTTISIPVKDIPAIQASIISTSVQAELIFFFIGLGIGVGFSYLYYRLLTTKKGTSDE
jgi:hypothetical protein